MIHPRDIKSFKTQPSSTRDTAKEYFIDIENHTFKHSETQKPPEVTLYLRSSFRSAQTQLTSGNQTGDNRIENTRIEKKTPLPSVKDNFLSIGIIRERGRERERVSLLCHKAPLPRASRALFDLQCSSLKDSKWSELKRFSDQHFPHPVDLSFPEQVSSVPTCKVPQNLGRNYQWEFHAQWTLHESFVSNSFIEASITSSIFFRVLLPRYKCTALALPSNLSAIAHRSRTRAELSCKRVPSPSP